MANPPKRLGRGLGSIISGGASPKPEAEKAPPSPKKHKKELSEVPAVLAPERAGKAPKTSKKVSKAKSEPVEGFRDIQTELIDPSPHQVRRDFDEEALKELADSIRSEGLIQPILVRPVEGRFELIAGERRYRACKLIGMRAITARVMEVGNSSAAMMTMIENLQRQDLNAIDEALGYSSLMQDFNLTQDEVAQRVGKARANIANHLRLLQLNKECQGYVSKGMLSFGHARALVGLESQEQQTLLARRIIESGMSVREAENQVSNWKSSSGKSGSARKNSVPESELAVVRDLEQRIASQLNTRVQLKHTSKKGMLSIEYYGNEDLQRLLERLGLES